MDEGAALGGPNVTWVKPPKVVMAVGEPTGTSVGHTWYLFDQVWKYPVTRVDARYVLSRLKLDDYDVLVLPSGSYGGDPAFGPAGVATAQGMGAQGGNAGAGGRRTFVGDGRGGEAGAHRAQAQEGGCLFRGKGLEEPEEGTAKERDGREGRRKRTERREEGGGAAEKPQLESPDPVPGAFLRATVYQDHWVNFGLPAEVDLLMASSLVLSR